MDRRRLSVTCKMGDNEKMRSLHIFITLLLMVALSPRVIGASPKKDVLDILSQALDTAETVKYPLSKARALYKIAEAFSGIFLFSE